MILASPGSGIMRTAVRPIVLMGLMVLITASVLVGCTYNFQPKDSKVEEIKVIPVGTVKPELDYSSDSPTCKVAAQRIADNIQVGMTQKDVKRLVGQPRLVFPGTWYWSRGIAKSGLPIVKFKTSRANYSVTAVSFTSESSAC